MRIYSALVLKRDHSKAFTGLKQLCEYYKIPYRAALKGKRSFSIGPDFISIVDADLVKIKGRENNFKKKQHESN